MYERSLYIDQSGSQLHKLVLLISSRSITCTITDHADLCLFGAIKKLAVLPFPTHLPTTSFLTPLPAHPCRFRQFLVIDFTARKCRAQLPFLTSITHTWYTATEPSAADIVALNYFHHSSRAVCFFGLVRAGLCTWTGSTRSTRFSLATSFR